MTSKDKIITAIRAIQPTDLPPLQVAINGIVFNDPLHQFIDVLSTIGGQVEMVASETELRDNLSIVVGSAPSVINALEPTLTAFSKANLYDVDIAIMRGGIAVAENGAIWVTEKNMVERMLPFSCQQLILVIKAKNIVNNLHEAYKKIDISEEGYGVFIAGPSKTADIEQSLVIGAHGPVSLIVYIIK